MLEEREGQLGRASGEHAHLSVHSGARSHMTAVFGRQLSLPHGSCSWSQSFPTRLFLPRCLTPSSSLLLSVSGLAKRVKARLLFSSTSEVYGDPEVSGSHGAWQSHNDMSLWRFHADRWHFASLLCHGEGLTPTCSAPPGPPSAGGVLGSRESDWSAGVLR